MSSSRRTCLLLLCRFLSVKTESVVFAVNPTLLCQETIHNEYDQSNDIYKLMLKNTQLRHFNSEPGSTVKLLLWHLSCHTMSMMRSSTSHLAYSKQSFL